MRPPIGTFEPRMTGPDKITLPVRNFGPGRGLELNGSVQDPKFWSGPWSGILV